MDKIKGMRLSDIVLLMLQANGGSLRGKTLAQKRAYFLNQFLQLGIPFVPHYYGPYSAELDYAIERCKALGFIEEKSMHFGVKKQGFEIRRYDYNLTPDGMEVVNNLLQRYPSECQKIIDVLQNISHTDKDDYMILSIAAKSLHILQTEGRPMTEKEIINEARQFGWEISEQAIDNAAEVLVKLGLVKKDES